MEKMLIVLSEVALSGKKKKVRNAPQTYHKTQKLISS